MEGTDPLAAYTRVKRLAAGGVEMAPNAKGARSDSRKDPSPRTKFPDWSAAHEREHAAKGYAGRFPSKGVDGTKSANSIRHASGADNTRRPAEIVENQRDVRKIESLDYRRECPRGLFQTDIGCGQAVALTGPRCVETNATKIGGETQDNVAPNKGPEASMHEQYDWALPNISDSDLGAFNFKSRRLKRPHTFRKP